MRTTCPQRHLVAVCEALVAATTVFLYAAPAVRADEPLSPPHPFAPGEVLTFDLKWQFISAGTATMSVLNDSTAEDGWRIEALAWSTGIVDFFYTVRDTIRSIVDRRTLLPRRFEKRQHEGWYHRDSVYTFDQERRIIYRKSGTYACSVEVYDILSSLYRLRASPLAVGGSAVVTVYADGKLYTARVKVLRRETVTVAAGTFSCLAVEPILQSEAIFVQKGRLWIWLTDDERRIPVLMQSAIPVGRIVAELVSYQPPSR